ncbi:MAG: zinc metalloprotease HtpX [Acidimicrobiia bacterium]
MLTMNKNTFKTYVLLAGLAGLLILFGRLIFGPSGAVLGLFLGLAVVGGSYWFSDKIAIKAARAVPASEAEYPDYYRTMREVSDRMRLPMPKLYVTPDLQPNAFATGRNPEHAAVAVTQGILQILEPSELRGVLAHEMSHVGNRDILIGSVAAAIATGISFIANIAMWGAMFGGHRDDREGGNPFAVLLLAILAPMAAGLLQMALSRSREFEADRSGAQLIGDGEPLARALLKLDEATRRIPMNVQPAQAQKYIVNPLAGRKINFAQLFTTHPPTEARVERLRSMRISGPAGQGGLIR